MAMSSDQCGTQVHSSDEAVNSIIETAEGEGEEEGYGDEF